MGIVRLLAVIVAAGGLIGVTLSSASATVAPHATLTVHKATCPHGVGPDIFEICHGNVLSGVSFDINGFEVGSQTITTDGSGVASGIILEAAVTEGIFLSEDPAVFGAYLGAYIYCSEQNSGDVLWDGSADTGAVSFEATQGDDIICDWYNITPAEEPSPAPTAAPGVTLPSTGAGQTFSESNSWKFGIATFGTLLALGAIGLRRRSS